MLHEHGSEQALVAEDSGAAGSNNFLVPRTVSPTQTLHLLADAGDDLANRHSTMTTTDWGLFSSRELKQCVTHDELVHIFDEQNTGSVEIICHNCGRLSHVERVCPSPKKKRSLPYIISVLQSKYNKFSSPSKRPPGRGQLPPFRSQPVARTASRSGVPPCSRKRSATSRRASWK